MKLAVAVAVTALAGCGADMMNNAALHAHVDELVQHEPPDPLDHVTTSLALLVPVVGTYRLDRAAFGSVRPSGVAFDWVLGGLAPLALVGASFAVADGRTRQALRWSALGLYVATRIGVLVIGNMHVSEFDDYLAARRSVGIGLRWQR
jgi:hypothetical protein